MGRVQKCASLALLLSALPATAYADTAKVKASATEFVLVLAIALLVLGCVYLTMKVFSFLKGGEMASGWQILAIAFVVMVIAEGINLFCMINVIQISASVILALRLVGFAATLIGFLRIKKVLS